MKTIKQIYKELYTFKDNLVKESDIIERIGFSTKWQIKNLLWKTRSWEEIDTYITLCPFYDGEWWIKWDYDDFSEVWDRYQNKFNASLEVINLLQNYFNLKLNFLLADQMVLVNSNYNTDKISEDIEWTLDLYNEKIKSTLIKLDFSIKTFSEIWLNLDNICDTSIEKTEDDIKWVLDNFWVDFDKFSFSMQIIINAFWMSWAYYLIKWYLEETKQLLDIFKENIIINTEAVWPLNSLYSAGDYKLDSKNMLVKVKI